MVCRFGFACFLRSPMYDFLLATRARLAFSLMGTGSLWDVENFIEFDLGKSLALFVNAIQTSTTLTACCFYFICLSQTPHSPLSVILLKLYLVSLIYLRIYLNFATVILKLSKRAGKAFRIPRTYIEQTIRRVTARLYKSSSF